MFCDCLYIFLLIICFRSSIDLSCSMSGSHLYYIQPDLFQIFGELILFWIGCPGSRNSRPACQENQTSSKRRKVVEI